tara:strand:+ start:2562 stop:2963 length:402 start_codon:yes stop_codon:yes gene_type:complete
MSGFRSPPVISGGTIRPARIVKLSTAADNTVLEAAAATTLVYGVAQEGTQDAPTDGASVNAAEAGDQVEIHTMGESCLVEAGATFTAGVQLMSDSSGRAITATAGNYVAGVSLKAGAVGELVLIQVTPGFLET